MLSFACTSPLRSVVLAVAYHSGQDSQNISHRSVKCPCYGTYHGVQLNTVFPVPRVTEELSSRSLLPPAPRAAGTQTADLQPSGSGIFHCSPKSIGGWQWENKLFGSFSSDVSVYQTNVSFAAALTRYHSSAERPECALLGPKSS